MKKVTCLTGSDGRYILIRNYGDHQATTPYAVLHVGGSELFIKTDKRIKSEDDFIKLYGYKCEVEKLDYLEAVNYEKRK
jgi:hypothetical protein